MPVLINRPNQDTLYQALNIYRDTMRPFIIRRLQVSGMPVEGAIVASLWSAAVDTFKKAMDNTDGNLETAIDVNMFEAIIKHNWNPAFSSEFAGQEILNDLQRISDIRNLVAHPEKRDIDRRQANDAFDAITACLKYAVGNEEAADVDRIMDELAGVPTIPGIRDALPQSEQVQEIAEQVTQKLEPIIRSIETTEEAAERIKQTLGKRVVQDLTPVIESLQRAQQQIAEDVAQRIESLITMPPFATDKVAAEVALNLTPALDSLRLTQQQITEGVAASPPDTDQIVEKIRQAVAPQVVQDLTPVLESLRLAQQQITEDASEQIRQAIAASRPETDQIAARTTERIAPVIREQTLLAEEAKAELLLEIRAMSAGIAEAIDNTRTTETPRQRRAPPAPRPSVGKPAPTSVADSWAEVVNHLRNVKGNRYYLAALLRDCRPIDVWQQRDPEKLILPFRHQYNLKRIEEELSDPRVQETVVQAIANHFGRELEFEVTLSVHAS